MKLPYLLLLIILFAGISCKQKEPQPQYKEYTQKESIEIKKKVLHILAIEEKRLAAEVKASPNNAEANKMYAFVLKRQEVLRQELQDLQR